LLANLYLTYAKLSALEEKLSSLENEVKGLERDVSNALYYSQRTTDAAAGAAEVEVEAILRVSHLNLLNLVISRI
jgi:hypothetical protein